MAAAFERDRLAVRKNGAFVRHGAIVGARNRNVWNAVLARASANEREERASRMEIATDENRNARRDRAPRNGAASEIVCAMRA